MKKVNVFIFLFLFLGIIIAKAQSNACSSSAGGLLKEWSLPPYYTGNPSAYSNETAYPQPGTTIVPYGFPYNGQGGIITSIPHSGYSYAAGNEIIASNEMYTTDQKGNRKLLFFIVDGTVYDGNGYLIGDIITGAQSYETGSFTGQGGQVVSGNTEWLIVPVPGNCDRYYLIGSTPETYIMGAGGIYPPYATYFAVQYIILDMSLTNPCYPNQNCYGAFVVSSSQVFAPLPVVLPAGGPVSSYTGVNYNGTSYDTYSYTNLTYSGTEPNTDSHLPDFSIYDPLGISDEGGGFGWAGTVLNSTTLSASWFSGSYTCSYYGFGVSQWLHLSATPIDENPSDPNYGTRYLLVNYANGLDAYKITGTGISAYKTTTVSGSVEEGSGDLYMGDTRGQMYVIPYTSSNYANVRYKVAWVSGWYLTVYPNESAYDIIVDELNADLSIAAEGVIAGNSYFYDGTQTPQGMALTCDGNTLYCTIDMDNPYPQEGTYNSDPLEQAWNVAESQLTSGKVTYTNGYPNSVLPATDMWPLGWRAKSTNYAYYEYSQIEEGTDGNYYLISQAGYPAAITNTDAVSTYSVAALNNPETGTPLTTIAGSNNYITGWPGGYNFMELNTLPNQISGEDYATDQANTAGSGECCQISYTSDVTNSGGNYKIISANNSGSNRWAPSGSNPFSEASTITIAPNSTIEVTNGAILEIESGLTLAFAPTIGNIKGGQIVVDIGGELKVDGGAILNVNNYCTNGLWPGITILGDPLLSQISSNQGKVTLGSLSEVKNAITGITANGGGIITASGSEFIDNQCDVNISNYPRLNNQCRFSGCTFKTDPSYIYLNSSPAAYSLYNKARVIMSFVSGIVFQANTFENTILITGANSIQDIFYRGSGISSTDASYSVNNCTCALLFPPGGCCGTANSFTGFCWGIIASNTNSSYSIGITGTQFTNNYADIDITNDDDVGITFNTFSKTAYLGNDPYCISCPSPPYNVYLDGCTAYNISYNSFSNSYYTSSSPSWGTVINNGGKANNFISHNTFTDIYSQSQSQGINGNILSNPEPGQSTGLQYWCNQYIQDAAVTERKGADIAVTVGPGNTSGLIDEIQGWGCGHPDAGLLTANNIFNYSTYSCSNANSLRSNLYTYPTFGYQLDYTWAGASSNDNPTCTSGPNIYVGSCTGLTADCTPTYTIVIQSGTLLDADGINYHTVLRTQKQAVKHERDSLNEVAARGNTPGLFSIISSGTPTVIQDSLLAPGPYLSDSVLNTAVRSAHVPVQNLEYILILNAPLDSNVMNVIESRGFPDSVINKIHLYQNDTIASQRTSLLEGVSYFQSIMDFTDNALITALETDTLITDPYDSAQAVLESDSLTLDRLARLANLQWAAGENSTALATVSTLSSRDVDSTYYNYCRLLPVLINLYNDTTGYTSLIGNVTDSTLIAQIAMDTLTPGYANARAVLGFVYGLQFAEPIMSLDTSGTGHHPIKENNGQGLDSHSSTSISQFKLYPNPANNNLTIEYSLSDKAQGVNLIMYDILGNKVADWSLPSGVSSNTMVNENISSLAPGMYFYSIYEDNKVVQRNKLVIAR